MRRFWYAVLVASTVILMALSFAVPPGPAWAAEKKDEKAVLDEVLAILKEKGQVTEEKYQELKARAKKEGAGKILAGIEGVRPYIPKTDRTEVKNLVGRLRSGYKGGERSHSL